MAEGSNAKPASVEGQFVPALHGLRAWAILLIVPFHLIVATGYTPRHALPEAFARSGYYALDALFLTSGFVLFLPVVRSGFGSARAFAIRRFARVGPPYYTCLLIILIGWPLFTTPASAGIAHHGVLDYAAHLGFVQREVLGGHAGLGVNGPLWALSVDFVYYLILPVIAGAYLRRPLAGLAAGLGISLVWRVAVARSGASAGVLVQPPLFAVDFAAGMTAAWLYTRIKDGAIAVSPRTAGAVAVAALAALVLVIYVGGRATPEIGALWVGSDAADLAFPLVLGIGIVAAAVAPPVVQWPLAVWPVQWFSEISYSVFLYHVLFISFAYATLDVALDGTVGSVAWLALAIVPLTLAVSYLSYRFVELPSRRYGRRLARTVAGGAASEAGTHASRAAALGTAQERV